MKNDTDDTLNIPGTDRAKHKALKVLKPPFDISRLRESFDRQSRPQPPEWAKDGMVDERPTRSSKLALKHGES